MNSLRHALPSTSTGAEINRCTSLGFLAILGPLFILWLAAALDCLPSPDGDSMIYVLSTIEYQRTGVARYIYFDVIDGGSDWFYPHGYLSQIVHAAIAPWPGNSGIYVANLVIFVCFELLFLSLCLLAGVPCLVAIGTLLLSINYLTPSNFRPELLAAAIIVAWLCCHLLAAKRANWRLISNVIATVALALLGVTQPTIAMLSAAFLSYALWFDRGWRAIIDIALIAIGSGIGAIAITEWVTGDFPRWFHLVLSHARSLDYWGSALDDYVFYYVTAPTSLLVGFSLLAAIGSFAVVHFAKARNMANLADRVLLHGVAAMVLVMIYGIGPRNPYTIYNVALFAPIVIALQWRNVQRLAQSWTRFFLVLAFGIGVTGSAASTFRNVIITATDLSRSDVVSWTQIVARIDALRHADSPFAIDEGFASAIEGDEKQHLVGVFSTGILVTEVGEQHDVLQSKKIKAAACLLLLKQSNSGYETAPEIYGFDLIESHFVSAARPFGLIIYRTTKGYNYAVYRSVRQACR